jgi:hypothetical protein
MPTASTSFYGATCSKVQMQDHLSIDTVEENGVLRSTIFHLIEWTGNATGNDCRGCNDGTNSTPQRTNAHPFNSALYASRIEIRPAEQNSRSIFQQRTEYSDDLDGATNPLSDPPIIEWSIAEDGQQPYFIDNNPAGVKPTVNTAGERFSDFLQRYQGSVSATFSINIPVTGSGSWNPATAIQYCGNPLGTAINNDTFTFDGYTVPQYVGRARGCTCGPTQKMNGVSYRVKKWSLAFKYNGWLDKIDNRGFNALVTMPDMTNKLTEIIKGIPPVKPDSPWPLYPSGHAMENVTDIPTPQLTFYPYPQLAFSGLGFV